MCETRRRGRDGAAVLNYLQLFPKCIVLHLGVLFEIISIHLVSLTTSLRWGFHRRLHFIINPCNGASVSENFRIATHATVNPRPSSSYRRRSIAAERMVPSSRELPFINRTDDHVANRPPLNRLPKVPINSFKTIRYAFHLYFQKTLITATK